MSLSMKLKVVSAIDVMSTYLLGSLTVSRKSINSSSEHIAMSVNPRRKILSDFIKARNV